MGEFDKIGAAAIINGFLSGINEGRKEKRELEIEERLLGIKEAAAKQQAKKEGLIPMPKVPDFLAKNDVEDVLDPNNPDLSRPIARIAAPGHPNDERTVYFTPKEKEMTWQETLAGVNAITKFDMLKDRGLVKAGKYYATHDGKIEIAKANIDGFKLVDPVKMGIPDQKMRGNFLNIRNKNVQAQRLADKIIANLKKGGPGLGFGTDVRTSEMLADISALMVGAKEVYKLGVLTGPDVDLIEKTMGKPYGTMAIVLEHMRQGTAVRLIHNLKDNLNHIEESEGKGIGYIREKPYDYSRSSIHNYEYFPQATLSEDYFKPSGKPTINATDQDKRTHPKDQFGLTKGRKKELEDWLNQNKTIFTNSILNRGAGHGGE